MKTAKEMFEELGYTYVEHDYNFEYRKHTKNDKYETKFEEIEVIYFLVTEYRFICENTRIIKEYSYKKDEGKEVTVEEYKAITQQMKELGWLDV